jgi:endo-1,4-beta-D-glucanase Y
MGNKKLSENEKGELKAYNDSFAAADPMGDGNLKEAHAIGEDSQRIYRNRKLMKVKGTAQMVSDNRVDKIKKFSKKRSLLAEKKRKEKKAAKNSSFRD